MQPGVSHLGSGLKRSSLCLAPPTWREVQKHSFSSVLQITPAQTPRGLHQSEGFHTFSLIHNGLVLDRWAGSQYSPCTGCTSTTLTLITTNTQNAVPCSLCASMPAASGGLWWCSQPQTGASKDTEEPAREKVYSWWQLIRAAEAATLSLHFSWAVDWQDSRRCRSSLTPSSQGPSVFLQNHRTPVGQQTSILSPSKGIFVFFDLTN